MRTELIVGVTLATLVSLCSGLPLMNVEEAHDKIRSESKNLTLLKKCLGIV